MKGPKPWSPKIARLNSGKERRNPPGLPHLNAVVILCFLLFLADTNAFGQGTAFTYQGQLIDNGGMANGTFNLQFSLYTNSTGGVAVAGPVTTNGVPVTNGLFTVTVDFGSAVWNGATNWLQIGVESNGATSFSSLTPRQEVTPSPYAIFAEGANAAGLSGTVPMSSLSGIYGGALSLTNTGNSFTGNGSGLANINALTLGGLAAGNFWQIGGNSGVPTGSNYIGNNDNQYLDIHANGVRVFRLRLFNDGLGLYTNAPNVIGGSSVNLVAANVVGATLAGGGGNETNGSSLFNEVYADFGTIGGGADNRVGSLGGTVSGGFGNVATNLYSMVGGGISNTVSGIGSFIGGGGYDGSFYSGNSIGDNAATIGGGLDNTILPGGTYGFIGGGGGNLVTNEYGVVSGGTANAAYGVYATVGGGALNVASGTGATVAGGGSAYFGENGNTASGYFATVGGGQDNTASGPNSTVAGGDFNMASGLTDGASTVAGGQNNTAGSYATVSGGLYNNAAGFGSFIGGGGYDGGYPGGNMAGGAASVVVGGVFNTNTGLDSVICGGISNYVGGVASFIGGGGYDGVNYAGNYINANAATIAGGYDNYIIAGARYSFIGGGSENSAEGYYDSVGGGFFNVTGGTESTVPGGYSNFAAGNCSFAAGNDAFAGDNGSFVWSDDTGTLTQDTDNNQFVARASGGFFFYTGTGSSGAKLASGATSWTTLCDRNAKKNFKPVDTVAVLNKLAAVPIEQWNYKWEKDSDTPNIGPMAQDFKKAFYPGRDDKGITTLEFDGVELAAIQGLNQKLQEQQTENAQLREELNELKTEVKSLEQMKGNRQ